jgi:hypothetical protein
MDVDCQWQASVNLSQGLFIVTANGSLSKNIKERVGSHWHASSPDYLQCAIRVLIDFG